MLSPPEVLERLEVQAEDLLFMLMDDVVMGKAHLKPEKLPPDLAVPFSEALILCPSKEAAEAFVKSDREGARAFLKIAAAAIENIKQGKLRLAPRRNEQETCFYLLVSVVREWLASTSPN